MAGGIIIAVAMLSLAVAVAGITAHVIERRRRRAIEARWQKWLVSDDLQRRVDEMRRLGAL